MANMPTNIQNVLKIIITMFQIWHATGFLITMHWVPTCTHRTWSLQLTVLDWSTQRVSSCDIKRTAPTLLPVWTRGNILRILGNVDHQRQPEMDETCRIIPLLNIIKQSHGEMEINKLVLVIQWRTAVILILFLLQFIYLRHNYQTWLTIRWSCVTTPVSFWIIFIIICTRIISKSVWGAYQNVSIYWRNTSLAFHIV